MNNVSSTFTIEDLREIAYRGSYSDSERALARELLALREAGKEPVGSFHITDQEVEATTDYVKAGEWPIDNGELLVYAAPQLPAVPDGDPRDEFELQFPMPKFVQRCGEGYSCSEFHAWDAHKFIDRFDGWNACLKAIRAAGGTVSEGR